VRTIEFDESAPIGGPDNAHAVSSPTRRLERGKDQERSATGTEAAVSLERARVMYMRFAKTDVCSLRADAGGNLLALVHRCHQADDEIWVDGLLFHFCSKSGWSLPVDQRIGRLGRLTEPHALDSASSARSNETCKSS
jgi:hypothetical protein